jgi:hypothetical protein
VGDVDRHRSYLSEKGQGEVVSVSDNRSSSPGGTMFSGRGERTYHRSVGPRFLARGLSWGICIERSPPELSRAEAESSGAEAEDAGEGAGERFLFFGLCMRFFFPLCWFEVVSLWET